MTFEKQTVNKFGNNYLMLRAVWIEFRVVTEMLRLVQSCMYIYIYILSYFKDVGMNYV